MDNRGLYHGNVSETEDGDECLHWNSHFILEQGVNPFTAFEDEDGLGPHNFCRSRVNNVQYVNFNSTGHLQQDSHSNILYDTETQTETRCPGVSSEEAPSCFGTTVM